MSNVLFNENGHVTENILDALKDGLLENNESILVAEHICICEKCAGYFANSFNDNELAEAPLGFEEEIQKVE